MSTESTESKHGRFDSPNVHELMPRRFKDYIVSEKELSSLGFLSALGGLLITSFGVAGGAALTLKVTLSTVTIPDVQTHANYVAAYLVACGFTVLCGVGSAISLTFTFFDVRRIKKDSEQEKRRRALAEAGGGVESSGYSGYSGFAASSKKAL